MLILCECYSFRCIETIEAPFEELQKARTHGSVLIAASCLHGPESTDRLVAEKDGYKVYTEGS